MGMFSGRRPNNLGVNGGKLAPNNSRPNNVHSQITETDSHFIAPLQPTRDPGEAFRKLKALVRELSRVEVTEDRDDYIHFETRSATMGFVDDNEFYLDRKAKLIHARAAARLGIRDFDANRKRIEALRAQLKAAGF
jgi:uncharacterized protein (DUF1499 family)